ncbi:anthranilate synthase component I family protein [Fulvivirga sp.]|uniref:anthranilate synthase component I family protein n=1 Tax=Fulvivirga sp. TaxID=1931237 RepID=UPI0032ECA436
MMKSNRFDITVTEEFIEKCLVWANGFKYFAYFCPNEHTYPHQPYQHLLMVSNEVLDLDPNNVFGSLQEISEKDVFIFGHFGYDLKNQLENLQSSNPDFIRFPDAGFSKALHCIHFNYGVTIESNNPESVLEEINKCAHEDYNVDADITFKPSISKEQYLTTVAKLKQHIIEGDIYEINYCQEFRSKNTQIDPISTFRSLTKKSPTPFSTLYKNIEHYLICASPERFIKKEGSKLVSQPIKGTARRGSSEYEDEIIKQELRTNEKELAENMMIVDLVRNDLAKSCIPGSVKVEQMFGIYTFNQWHQMISTVTGQLKNEVKAIEAIKNAFPMGSMTGAPKIKVMELIEKYEVSKRGIYSGSVGYFSPNGDFDFNVVIRSLIYNSSTKNLSFQVGGAITYDSDANAEYEECLLKASAISSLFKIDKSQLT